MLCYRGSHVFSRYVELKLRAAMPPGNLRVLGTGERGDIDFMWY